MPEEGAAGAIIWHVFQQIYGNAMAIAILYVIILLYLATHELIA